MIDEIPFLSLVVIVKGTFQVLDILDQGHLLWLNHDQWETWQLKKKQAEQASIISYPTILSFINNNTK